MADQRFLELAWFQVDSATVGVGDASWLAISLDRLADLSRIGQHCYIDDFSDRGVNLVSVRTGEDGTYPLEVSRGAMGELRCARVCFTTDVDKLERRREGRWKDAAELRISSGTLIVGDGFVPEEMPPVAIRAPNGAFPVEIFALAGDADVLGVRVRFTPALV